ncbi:MAG: TIGR02302 family protein [Pseudomonadota bacterium]
MNPTPETDGLASLKRPVQLTWLGLLAERLCQAFWPLWSVFLIIWALLAFGVPFQVPAWGLFGVLSVAIAATVGSAFYGVRRMVWPSRMDALIRLDSSMPGRPISGALDTMALGTEDTASQAVWRAHVARMERKLQNAKPVPGDLQISKRDPYALRFVALLAFVMAFSFGSIWRGDLPVSTAIAGDPALATGPSWEIWIEPPVYTGKPSLYLNDIEQARLDVPLGSDVIVRLYGDISKIGINETVSAAPVAEPGQSAYEFSIEQNGRIEVVGDAPKAWDIAVTGDQRPEVTSTEEIERKVSGELALTYMARDDYSVERGEVTISLDLPSVDRRYGLAIDPEDRATLTLDLPMPFAGDRAEFTETLIENLAEHPWAGLPVHFELTVEDSADQRSDELVVSDILPGRRFFQPIAKAVVEQRRDLLWSMENTNRVATMLRTITYDPEDFFPNEQAYLTLRRAITVLDLMSDYDYLGAEKRDEVAEMLWNAAMLLEVGRLKDALERLQRAQDRLSEAMKDGATDEEIAELMQELSEAMREYMNQLAQEADPQDMQNAQNQNGQQITGDQLQEMLDRIQELMEQGRMDEAEELLSQLMEMMQNMQVAQGQQGQGEPQPGQQAMEGLQETLRDQQGLSDEAFRDLQEQFNPGAQAGENENNQGRNGGQGRGETHEGRNGEGPSQNSEPGQEGGGQGEQSLADRQQQLQRELNRQAQNLPGGGTPEGDAAREALDRAGEAMERAEDALRDDRTADALGAQSEAMEALREGMRNLGEAMAQQQQQNGQQGANEGQASEQMRDPLGRDVGNGGQIGSESNMVQDEDSRRRSRELMDEIRRRSGEQNRPQLEKDYLRRLLDRF